MKFDAYKGLRKRKGRILPAVLLGFAFVVIAAIVGSYSWYNSQLQPVNETELSSELFTVEVGATIEQIGEQLEDAELIRSSNAFSLYARFNGTGSGLQAGGYKLSASMSVQDIMTILTEGAVANDLVTILPGQRLDQIAASLAATTEFNESQVAAALAVDQYEDHPALMYKPDNANLEGYLFPESYQLQAGEPLENIIRQALDQMALLFTSATLRGIQQQGLTPHEALIIASIVDKEVNNLDDKPIVAQVFLKRYREGIMLGSDVTALYGAAVAGLDLAVFADTPYNTRLYTGLPPGPISNISQSGMDAVINPSTTDYLFFVAGDDGKTYFSNTLAEHEALTAEHCIELCALF